MTKTIILKQETEEIDMNDIASRILYEIDEYFEGYLGIDAPSESITNYNDIINEILNYTIKYFNE